MTYRVRGSLSVERTSCSDARVRWRLSKLLVVCTASMMATACFVSIDEGRIATKRSSNETDQHGDDDDDGEETDPGSIVVDAGPVSMPEAGPCATALLFCRDFDDSARDFTTGFVRPSTSAGPFSFDTTNFASAPRSLLATVNARTQAGALSTSLWRDFSIPPGGRIQVAFDFRASALGSTSVIDLSPIELRLDPPPTGKELVGANLSLREGSWKVFGWSQGDGIEESPSARLDAPAPLDTWHHLAVLYDQGVNQFTFTLDGNSASVTMTSVTPTTLKVGIGAPYTRLPAGTWSVNIDNYVVDEPK